MSTAKSQVWATLGVIVAAVSCTGGEPGAQQADGRGPEARAEAAPSFPDAGPNQLWISSIPVGLECYVASGGTTSAGAVFASTNREGVTPLLVDLPPGLYEIGFAMPRGSGVPDAEYGPRFNGGLGHAIITAGNAYRVVFSDVQKGEGAGSFIGLAFDSALDDAQIAALYPPGHNFTVDETQVREVFEARGLDPAGVAPALELLARGGKVLLRSAPPSTTVELKMDGTVEVVPPVGG